MNDGTRTKALDALRLAVRFLEHARDQLRSVDVRPDPASPQHMLGTHALADEAGELARLANVLRDELLDVGTPG